MARSLRVPSFRFKAPKIPRLPNVTEPYEDVFEEMTLQEHLEELRSRIVKTCISIGVAFLAGLYLSPKLLEVLKSKAQATNGLVTTSPTEPFVITMKVALYIAIAIAMPIIIWHLIGFLAPGLTRKEKRVVFSALPFISGLFLVGAAFAFFIAAPRALYFLSHFNSNLFNWLPLASEVVSFYLTLMIGMGLGFELPVVMFLLAKLHIVSARRQAAVWKYCIILIMVLSAIITPTPDPMNMMIVASPLFLLYGAGLLLARAAGKPREART